MIGPPVPGETVTGTIPVAAAIARAQRPHVAPPRHCPECGAKQSAGRVRCRECVGGMP